ncbi:MAG: TCR/Tet family MFS transporter [Paracoccaceae bacterium]
MQRRLPVLFILITVVIDSMGIGLIFPVMPDLIREVTGRDLAHAALWGGVLSTGFAVMQFLFGPLLGNLSDRYGRRPVLLVSLAVMAADYLVMALAGSIWLLFAGRIVGGITAATHSTASAYMADISRPEEKAANFGLIGAAFGLGFILGPVLGGLLAGYGTRAPFYAAGALAAINMVFGWTVLRETVSDAIRRPFELRRAHPFGAFRSMTSLPGMGRLLVFLFLYEFAVMVYPATWAYFTQERFDWAPGMVGLSLTVYGLASILVQAVLIRPVLRWLGEARTILAGLAFNVVAFVVLASLTNGLVALVFTPVSALGSVVTPALQALLSHRAASNQQGELQGAVSSIRSMAMILSPLVMTGVFATFTGPAAPVYLPGAAFLLCATLMVVCGLVFVARTRAPAGA